jgi:hypothetical protein
MSHYGYATYDKDGKWSGWTRLGLERQEADIKAKLDAGSVLQICRIGGDCSPLRRDESKMFDDMTYEACRRRYDDERNAIIARIKAGSVSASMSGIEYYQRPWDETPPEQWDDLSDSLTWNGVRHIKTDWRVLLEALHPLSRAAR